jgi:hypothetical protein
MVKQLDLMLNNADVANSTITDYRMYENDAAINNEIVTKFRF